jgi:hypothetical protein
MQNDSVGAKKRASATIGRPMCWCSVHHFIEAILPGDASYVGTSFVGSNHELTGMSSLLKVRFAAEYYGDAYLEGSISEGVGNTCRQAHRADHWWVWEAESKRH